MNTTDKTVRAILTQDEEALLARLDSYDSLKHEFLSLNQKYNELLEAISLHSVMFGALERSKDFESFRSAVSDKHNKYFLKREARMNALVSQGNEKNV